MSKKILIIVTSCGESTSGKKTGIWLEEYVIPYLLFKKAGFDITVASVKGGDAPLDPNSVPDDSSEKKWVDAMSILKTTLSVSDIDPAKYDAVFFPGGHGTMFDLPNNTAIANILRHFYDNMKTIAAVCHGPACFIGVTLEGGRPLIAGHTVTAFTNEEELAAGHDKDMPFLLESALLEEHANFLKASEWSDHIETDAILITGQNPQSSESVATAVISTLSQ